LFFIKFLKNELIDKNVFFEKNTFLSKTVLNSLHFDAIQFKNYNFISSYLLNTEVN